MGGGRTSHDTPVQCAPDFSGDMTRQEWTLVSECAEHSGYDVVDTLGVVLDYAKHHSLSQRTIDSLEDWHNKAASVCLRAPDAVQEFIDELAARDRQPHEDSFCDWCHQRDERRNQEFIRSAMEISEKFPMSQPPSQKEDN
jgi:hypothetical protein